MAEPTIEYKIEKFAGKPPLFLTPDFMRYADFLKNLGRPFDYVAQRIKELVNRPKRT